MGDRAGGRRRKPHPTAPFSKEPLPVESRFEDSAEQPRAVNEYLVERMIIAGATKICFVVSPGKTDILEYYGGSIGPAQIAYTVQSRPAGVCDAIFRALPLIAPEESVIVGLPDTIWFPADALRALPAGTLAFLLFPVERPELFDAVATDADGAVLEIEVKQPNARSHWIWGAFPMPGEVLADRHRLWRERDERDEYIGTLVKAYLARGGRAIGVRAGRAYVEVGTLHGYREAIEVLKTVAAGAGLIRIVPECAGPR